MNDNYLFPAVINYASDGITIFFPDLPGRVSGGDDIREALRNAREALEGWIYLSELDHEEIPSPSKPASIAQNLSESQAMTLVDVFMPPVRSAAETKSVNKMVTLPQWLINEGKKAGINFSHTLQDALMDKLGITRAISRRRVK